MPGRRVFVAAAALLLAVVVVVSARRVAVRVAVAVGGRLALLRAAVQELHGVVRADPAPPSSAPGAAPAVPDGAAGEGAEPAPGGSDSRGAARGSAPAPDGSRPRSGSPRRGTSSTRDRTSARPSLVRIGPRSVLRLARAGQIPETQPVAASPGLPAGLRVLGVGALGVGLESGDVLESVAGTPVTSRQQAIDALIVAHGRGASSIPTRWRRAGQPLTVVVELPSDEELEALAGEGLDAGP